MLDTLVADGVIANYGVASRPVTRRHGDLQARHRDRADHPQRVPPKPLEAVLPSATANGVGIIARVPLA